MLNRNDGLTLSLVLAASRMQSPVPSFIHHIQTAVPEFAYSQTYARDKVKAWVRDPKQKRLVHAIYNRSGIDTRHSVSGDFIEGVEGDLFKIGEDGSLDEPGTQARNALYSRSAKKMAVSLARETLENCPEFRATEITHIVFASCTGFCNPGPDYHIVRALGLPESVERYTLGFMGCYAAFPALRMASQFCEANPEAVVLVICLELCSLHLQINDDPSSLLANSLFADGAAAVIVSAREPDAGALAYQIDGFASTLVPSGEEDMAWDIGDRGFNIVLSSYVPEIIGANISALLTRVLAGAGMSLDDIGTWAVHPGGRAILDKVRDSLHLEKGALSVSREVLRRFGNMSSATILFVLDALRRADVPPAGPVCALAFGPGLTVESALLTPLGTEVAGGQAVTLASGYPETSSAPH